MPGLWGRKRFPSTTSCVHTHTSYSQADAHQLSINRSRLRAERGSLTPATCRPERSETCWFASSTLLHSQLSKTKAVPRGRICGPLQGKRAQVGATRMRIAMQRGGTGCRGLRAGCGKPSASLFHTYDSQGRAAPTQPPPRLDARPAWPPSPRSDFPRSIPGVRATAEPEPRR